MKKYIFIFLATMLASGAVKAQTPDTVSFHQLGDIYYNIWYDTCTCFLNGDAVNHCNLTVRLSDSSAIVAIPYDVSHPMLVKGVVVMEVIDFSYQFHWSDSNHLPEYALLYHYDAALDTMILIDSARWDTIQQPKVLGLPLRASSHDDIYYCHAFSAYFKQPIMVNSPFYVGGTHKSNHGSSNIWTNRPVQYEAIGFWSGGAGCVTKKAIYYCQDYGWYSRTSLSTSFPFGGFIPIVEMSDLIGETADSTGGYVTGSGRYPTLSEQVLTAVAAPGYHFAHWNDGDTYNPRTVLLTQDTTLAATFYQDGSFQVSASSNDTTQGRVFGEGRYIRGDTAILTAIPLDGYRFSRWNDGDTANPRSIVVTQDTLFIAFFEDAADTTSIAPVAQATALFTLAPNPATGKVTVEVKNDKLKDNRGVATLTLRDAAGHEVRRIPLPAGDTALTLDLSDLPAGAYFVTLSTPTASSTQRLVVQ